MNDIFQYCFANNFDELPYKLDYLVFKVLENNPDVYDIHFSIDKTRCLTCLKLKNNDENITLALDKPLAIGDLLFSYPSGSYKSMLNMMDVSLSSSIIQGLGYRLQSIPIFFVGNVPEGLLVSIRLLNLSGNRMDSVRCMDSAKKSWKLTTQGNDILERIFFYHQLNNDMVKNDIDSPKNKI